MKFDMSNKPIKMFSFSSMTDIVMLLLIFFLLTSQFVVTTGVKVKLPGAKNNEQTSPSKLVVSIDSYNKIYLGRKEIGVEGLAGAIAEKNTKGVNANLIIRADKAANIETVIKVIDAAKSAGIERFTIETKKESY
ncbi:MAG: biopolymer transporter ExbD [Chlorobi bacterium]|nr:biopolymer transporter ExbD [Chlorobiota bacterium]